MHSNNLGAHFRGRSHSRQANISTKMPVHRGSYTFQFWPEITGYCHTTPKTRLQTFFCIRAGTSTISTQGQQRAADTWQLVQLDSNCDLCIFASSCTGVCTAGIWLSLIEFVSHRLTGSYWSLWHCEFQASVGLLTSLFFSIGMFMSSSECTCVHAFICSQWISKFVFDLMGTS